MMSITRKSRATRQGHESSDAKASSLDQPKPSALPLVVMQLAGSEPQMGQQHGRFVQELGQWEGSLDYYPNMPGHMLGGALPKVVMQTAGKAAIEGTLRAMSQGRPEAYRERTRAFVQALGRPGEFGRYFFVMDVLQNLVGWSSHVGLEGMAYRMGNTIPPACTSLAAFGQATEDGRTLHARNFDFPGVGLWDRAPVVVFCSPANGLRYGFVTTRGADAVGVSAFNEAGLTLTMHTRFHGDVILRGTGVLDLGHEIIAHARTLEQAVEIARRSPVASSWGVLVSSASQRRALSIETAGRKVRVVEPAAGQDFVACANRYRDPDMIRGEATVSPAFIANSNGRERMARRYGERGGLDVEALKRLLASHEDPQQPGLERAAGSVVSQPLTVQSIVVDPERQVVHVASGRAPTGAGPWMAIPFAWDSSPGYTIRREGAQELEREPSRFDEPKRQRALQSFIEAVRLHQQGGDRAEVFSHLKRASVLDPEEPTYHFLAGAEALSHGLVAEAEAHFEQSLEHERGEFYRGQTLLWAARAAEARGHKALARHHRQELGQTRSSLLARHRDLAARELQQAYDPARFARVKVLPHLVDAGL